MTPKLNSMKFRKKPVVIDAMQWTGENLLDIIRFTGLNSSASHFKWDEYAELVRNEGLKIFTLEGKMSANIGDWIIKGVKGEFYPCKEDIFNMTYELANPDLVTTAEELLFKEMMYIATISTGQVNRVAKQAIWATRIVKGGVDEISEGNKT
jgi:hypothetical protein